MWYFVILVKPDYIVICYPAYFIKHVYFGIYKVSTYEIKISEFSLLIIT